MLGHFHASRRQRLQHGRSNQLVAVGDTDSLSEFPEEIHRKIFSFLPTVDAARAGFCWKTWRTIWYSESRLIFDYNLFPETKSKLRTFRRFIDQTLAHHDESDVIEFTLCFLPVMDRKYRIEREWITFAMQHNVQKLVLCGKINKGQNVLRSVFSCQSLVKLELAVQNHRLTWSGTSTLPNLRKLKLKYLLLSGLSLRQDPFSCLPALEKLSIFSCHVMNLEILSVSASKLKEFTMCSCPGMENCLVSFQTPLLSKLIYIIEDATVDELTMPPHMFGLVLSGGDPYVKSESPFELRRSILKVTRELCKAYRLMINPWLIEYLSLTPDLPRHMAADVFNNLMFLNLTVWPVVEHVRTVLLLATRCPYLSELYLELVEARRETRQLPGVDDDAIGFSVEGSFCSLSRIEVNNFGGGDIEMMLVRLCLAYAHELDLMTIWMNKLMLDNMEVKINKILEYEKASTFADVIFN